MTFTGEYVARTGLDLPEQAMIWAVQVPTRCTATMIMGNTFEGWTTPVPQYLMILRCLPLLARGIIPCACTWALTAVNLIKGTSHLAIL